MNDARLIRIVVAVATFSIWVPTVSHAVVRDGDNPSSEAKTKRGTAWTIHYANSLKADADLIDTLMAKVHAATLVEFADFDTDKLIAMLSLDIYIHAAANQYASSATMTVRTSYSNQHMRADLHLLAPSKHTVNDVTIVGERKDASYFHKTLMHEYASVIVSLLTKSKSDGWRFQQAPAWVVQGYPEFLGLMRTTEAARKTTFGKYHRLVKENPQRVSFDFGLEVSDPYVDGAVLFAFMHERYGGDKMRRIFSSQKRTFGRAIRSELGVDLASFEAAWRKWLAGD